MGRTCGFDNSLSLLTKLFFGDSFSLLHMLPGLTAVFAFITSMIASFWCESIQIRPASDLPEGTDLVPVGFGLWQAQSGSVEMDGERVYVTVENTCTDYVDEWSIDGNWRAARAFSVLAPLLGGLGFVALILAPIGWYPKEKTWKRIAHGYIFVTLSQGLTFLIFRSNICTDNHLSQLSKVPSTADYYPKDCEWNDGSSANVASTLLWFATALLMFKLGTPTRVMPEVAVQQDITDTKGDDGNVEETHIDEHTTSAQLKYYDRVAV